MNPILSSRTLLPALALAAGLTLSGCSSGTVAANGSSTGTSGTSAANGSTSGSAGSSGSTGLSGGSSGSTGTVIPADFPAAPVLDPGMTPAVVTLFQQPAGDGGAGVGPCLSEPTLGALIPRNWTPLRFEWTPAPGENVFELRLHVANQQNDLLVYTSAPGFTLDGSTWSGLASHSAGQDVAVTLRGATLDVSGSAFTTGPDPGASGVVHLAPVSAPGTVVYWTSSSGTAFKGFTIGDPSPTAVLTPALASPTSTGATANCVACHASSPDGNLIIYSRDANDGTRAIDARKTNGDPVPPAEISLAALQLLGRNKQTAPVLSPAHYSAADSVALSIFNDPTLTAGQSELIWTNLHAAAADATGWGIVARTGDTRMAGSPSWRHDGTAVAYVSAPSVGEGVIASGADYDIYTVPYNGGAGGAATPVPGASDPIHHEFYPVYSPGDTLLAFNRTDEAVSSYNQPSAELFVVPTTGLPSGGTATRLVANDPPACTGLTSPGLTNSWARWAPSAQQVGDEKYYWVVFSSKRHAGSADGAGVLIPQLYIAGIVTKVENGVETLEHDYPALYVGSQDPGQSNHTPAWDTFKLNPR